MATTQYDRELDDTQQANKEIGDARADEPLTESPRQEETRRGRNDQTPGGLSGDPAGCWGLSANLFAGHPARPLGPLAGLSGTRDGDRRANGDGCGFLWGRGLGALWNHTRRRSGRARLGYGWSRRRTVGER